jgi:hypothetical protein
MRITRRLHFIGGLLLALVASNATAQDTNYWAIQYGPVGQLLGGQVIGDARELSATYYNPGGLALEDGSSFLLSTESFQIEQFDTTPTADLDLFETASTRFGTAPTLVAGILPRGWLGEHTRLAWSFLTRQSLETRLSRRLEDPLPLPGVSSASELYLDEYVNESWGGLTLSRPVSETVGVGMTLYGVYRGQRGRSEVHYQALSNDEAALSIVGVEDFSYYHFRTLAKLGVAWERENFDLGLSVTTPSLALFGSGRAGLTQSLVGVDADGNGVPDPPYLESQTEENLDSRYKSSWAIGGGAGWDRGATRWHMSAEWFAPVDRFNVIQLPAETSARQFELTQQLESVFNIGLGVEHEFDNGVVLYGAGLTDFTASTDESAVNIAVSNWNLYHLSSGVKFAFAGSRFTLGATYTWGGQPRPLPLIVPDGSFPGAGLDAELDISYRRVVVLLGFLFGEGR